MRITELTSTSTHSPIPWPPAFLQYTTRAPPSLKHIYSKPVHVPISGASRSSINLPIIIAASIVVALVLVLLALLLYCICNQRRPTGGFRTRRKERNFEVIRVNAARNQLHPQHNASKHSSPVAVPDSSPSDIGYHLGYTQGAPLRRIEPHNALKRVSQRRSWIGHVVDHLAVKLRLHPGGQPFRVQSPAQPMFMIPSQIDQISSNQIDMDGPYPSMNRLNSGVSPVMPANQPTHVGQSINKIIVPAPRYLGSGLGLDVPSPVHNSSHAQHERINSTSSRSSRRRPIHGRIPQLNFEHLTRPPTAYYTCPSKARRRVERQHLYNPQGSLSAIYESDSSTPSGRPIFVAPQEPPSPQRISSSLGLVNPYEISRPKLPEVAKHRDPPFTGQKERVAFGNHQVNPRASTHDSISTNKPHIGPSGRRPLESHNVDLVVPRSNASLTQTHPKVDSSFTGDDSMHLAQIGSTLPNTWNRSIQSKTCWVEDSSWMV